MRLAMIMAGIAIGFSVAGFSLAGGAETHLAQMRMLLGIGSLAYAGFFIAQAMDAFAAKMRDQSAADPTRTPQVERASSREDQP